jgi:hypothetical protein
MNHKTNYEASLSEVHQSVDTTNVNKPGGSVFYLSSDPLTW